MASQLALGKSQGHGNGLRGPARSEPLPPLPLCPHHPLLPLTPLLQPDRPPPLSSLRGFAWMFSLPRMLFLQIPVEAQPSLAPGLVSKVHLLSQTVHGHPI